MYKFTFVAPTEVPQHMIDMRLTESFLQQIGGLRSFDDHRIVLRINFNKTKDEFQQYREQYVHTLSVEITEVMVKDFVEYKSPQFHEVKVKYTRLERFKQFVKGE